MPFLLPPARCALIVWVPDTDLDVRQTLSSPRHNPTFSSVKRTWDQVKEQHTLCKPDPSQSYFEAPSFLASRNAVIPLIQENKHMMNIYGKKQVTHK